MYSGQFNGQVLVLAGPCQFFFRGQKTKILQWRQWALFAYFLANVNVIHVRYMLLPAHLSVVCRLSVTFVRPTQAVQIVDNISTALGTLAIH